MEHCSKEVLVRTKPFTLVVSDNSANIRTTFNPPRYLHLNYSYELAMMNLETYYTFANIREVNNFFKWSVDDGKTWTILHVPINAETVKLVLMYQMP